MCLISNYSYPSIQLLSCKTWCGIYPEITCCASLKDLCFFACFFMINVFSYFFHVCYDPLDNWHETHSLIRSGMERNDNHVPFFPIDETITVCVRGQWTFKRQRSTAGSLKYGVVQQSSACIKLCRECLLKFATALGVPSLHKNARGREFFAHLSGNLTSTAFQCDISGRSSEVRDRWT